MNVLLTGAAGSIGYETLKHLIKTTNNITVLELKTNRNKKRLNKYKNKVSIYYGSINDYQLVSKLVKKNDIVIHLAAIIPPLADINPELTRKVNFYGTRNIVKAIAKYNNKAFLIYSSSVSVYGDRIKDYYIRVGDELKPSEGDYYALTKIETEKMIEESNINYTIFRLTGIMGRPDTDPLMFHMPLDTKLEIATTKDTAKAFIESINHTKQLNHHIYNLGGGESCRTTYKDFLDKMFSLYGLNDKYFKKAIFAEKNFHCGYFLDSYKLNDILHFQNDSLDSYYERIQKETNLITKVFTKIFSRPIIYFLLKKSEPMQAKKKGNNFLIQRFFKNKKDS